MKINLGYLALCALFAGALAGCNDGVGPIPGDNRAGNNQSTGTGAGNSATGATGGSATSPGQDAGATPGVSSGDTSGGTATANPGEKAPDRKP